MSLDIITGFLDQHNLPWLILALLSWIIIYFLCSSRCFLKAFPVGLWTMTVGAILEHFFIEHKFWEEQFIMIPLGELDLFVIIGPFFAIGVILIRVLPENRLGKFLTVLFLSIIAVAVELAAIQLGFLSYNEAKWGLLNSLIAYSIGLMSALGFYYAYYSKSASSRIYP
ncbi:hypothetical protein [Candidatus Contubernalis alkaliaceticus]|uniref:hypothetical protein n=1 Tax=Candidatus Contubernalis alkaliaceticus TaxID=338645 RepID=UPI001F4C1127|nr:hypothetical protein [Candidatus Contubernalis alkalaceticus]UNC90648.1 hypothetical protein HUE98_00215 [Candidatus Contubernalis alkalaceticus]